MRRVPKAVLCAAVGMVLAAVCMCASTCMPAYATYADVADSYGSVKEPKPSGDAIYAADVPNGKYGGIEVRTSSSFCDITNCTVVKNDSGLFATFTLSRSYNAIFLGTDEEAVALTNSEGTDDSAYILGKEITVGKGKFNQFTIGLPALNEPFDLATFNGGSKGIDDGCWYNRSVVFDASSELILAVQSGTAPEPEPQEEPKKEEDKPAKQEETERSSSEKAKTTQSSSKKKTASKKTETKAAKTKKTASKKKTEPKKKEEKGASAAGITVKPSTPQGGSGAGSGSDGNAATESSKQAATQKASVHGVPLRFATLDLDVDTSTAAAAPAEPELASSGVDLRLFAVALFVVVLLAAGFALRTVAFRREKASAHA